MLDGFPGDVLPAFTMLPRSILQTPARTTARQPTSRSIRLVAFVSLWMLAGSWTHALAHVHIAPDAATGSSQELGPRLSSDDAHRDHSSRATTANEACLACRSSSDAEADRATPPEYRIAAIAGNPFPATRSHAPRLLAGQAPSPRAPPASCDPVA